MVANFILQGIHLMMRVIKCKFLKSFNEYRQWQLWIALKDLSGKAHTVTHSVLYYLFKREILG